MVMRIQTLLTRMKTASHGFTIVEIIVVVTAIAILAAIGSYSYLSYTSYARDTKREASMKTLAAALERYYDDKGQYPSVANMTTTNVTNLSALLKIDREVLKSPTATTSTVNSVVNYSSYVSSTADVYRYQGISTDTAECETNTNLEPIGVIRPRFVASLEPLLAVGTIAGYCESFALSYRQDSDNTWQYVYSRH